MFSSDSSGPLANLHELTSIHSYNIQIDIEIDQIADISPSDDEIYAAYFCCTVESTRLGPLRAWNRCDNSTMRCHVLLLTNLFFDELISYFF